MADILQTMAPIKAHEIDSNNQLAQGKTAKMHSMARAVAHLRNPTDSVKPIPGIHEQ